MKKLAVYLVTVIFLSISATAVYGAEEAVKAKSLFEQKCSLCHTIDRPKSKQKTAEAWKSTVMRMKNTNGAPVTDEEAKTIIEYLTENYGT
jgi:mono/diheme cytochrome c family protein